MIQLQENHFFGERDRFRLVRLLGRYEFTEVWLADDTQSGSAVAIKVYPCDDGGNLLRYEVFEQMPCLLMPGTTGVWSSDLKRSVSVSPQKSKTAGKKMLAAAIAATLILGLCAGFFAGNSNPKTPSQLFECISLIEQGDDLFSDTDKTTWREVLAKYLQAKELTDRYHLQLPDMDSRINHVRQKMESAINLGIETAKIFYSGGSTNMAITTLENEVLKIDPEHQEGNELKKEYSKSL